MNSSSSHDRGVTAGSADRTACLGANAQMTVVHLTASPCYGGPERQMLQLGKELSNFCRSIYATFLEEGRCWDFVRAAESQGFASFAVKRDFPRLVAALHEVTALLRSTRATVLCTHGYKANVLGLVAARWVGVPIVAVSHGWTGETVRVRLFERVDHFVLRKMDKVVCVSEAQAAKVRKGGVRPEKIVVIRNAIRPGRFQKPQPGYGERLRQLFHEPPHLIVGAAGRLSPEKGFNVLIDAAAQVVGAVPSVGFVVFGDGRLRDPLAEQIRQRGLTGRFVLASFCHDLDHYMPHFDLVAMPSLSEGLPNVALEASAAAVPVVGTTAGGIPEVVEHGTSGLLVPPGDPAALAKSIIEMLSNDSMRRRMGSQAQKKAVEEFSTQAQAQAYRRLFDLEGNRCAPKKDRGAGPAAGVLFTAAPPA